MKKSLFFILMAVCILAISCSKNDSSDDGDDGGSTNGLKTGQVEMKVYPTGTKNQVTFTLTAKKISINWGDGSIEEHTPNGVEKEYVHMYSSQNFQTILIETDEMTSISIRSVYGREGKTHELNLGDCSSLKNIKCESDKLIRLDLGICESLEKVTFISASNISYINVSNASKLNSLYVTQSYTLKELRVKNCISLESLTCRANKLKSLDLSGCKSLKSLDCSWNDFSEAELNKIFEDLPVRTQGDDAKINVAYNTGTSNCNKAIAENKGWKFVDYWWWLIIKIW